MKYTPKYKIKSVKFTHKGKQYDVEGSNVLTGIYEYEKGGKLKDYTYISKNDVKEFVTEGKIIKTHSNGIWVLSKVLKETPKKAIKKSTPKKEIKKTTTNKKSVSKAKIGTLLTPSEKFKGKKNMPVMAFEIAEKMVEMKKAKAKKSEIMKIQNDLFQILQQEKSSEFLHEPLAYTVLWLNFNMPMSYGFTVLNEQDIYGLGLIEAYKKEFKNFPDVSKKVIKIKTGNFTSNLIEQKLSKDFAGNDDLRPNMKFTYIDDGYAVSTDAHKLLAIYDKSLLGKEEFFGGKDELWKLGKMAKYPKWRQVVPNKYSLKTKKINAQLLYNFLLKAIKYKATSGYSYGIIIKINKETSIGFNARLLIEGLGASMKFGDNVYLHYVENAKQKPVLFSNIEDWDIGKPNSTFVLLMPIMVYDNSNDAYLTYDLNTESYEKGGEINTSKKGVYLMELKDGTFRVSNNLGDRDFPYEFNDVFPTKERAMKFANRIAKNSKSKVVEIKYAKGGEIDLFEDYQSQPKELSEIVEKYEERYADGDMDYKDTEKFLKEVNAIGYTFDSGLDNEPYNLRPMMAKGGKVLNLIEEITEKLKQKTKNDDGKFGFYIDTPSRHDIYWRDSNSENPLWSIGTSTDPRYKGRIYLSIKGKRKAIDNANILFKEIKNQEDISKRTNFYSYDSNDINNALIFAYRDLGINKMAKGGKTKTKKPNSFFAVVKREQKEGESWKDAIQRVKKEKSKKKQ